MLVIGFVLTIQLRSFPLFFQERGITLSNNRFRIIKFKTMKKAKTLNDNFRKNHILNKPELTHLLTGFTFWLRRTGLDELPQLFNVIIGDMSLIGPRPLMIDDLITLKKYFPNLYYNREQINSRPGISGLWQIHGDRSKGVHNLINLENQYENTISFLLDLKLAISTIPIILYAKHSDAVSGKKKNSSRNIIDKKDFILEN